MNGGACVKENTEINIDIKKQHYGIRLGIKANSLKLKWILWREKEQVAILLHWN